jgi:hypothetical protein
VNGRYRLCGLLAVNQPGYLVQRASSDGGVITAGPCACEEPVDPLAEVEARLAELEAWREAFIKGETGELLTLDA